MSDALNPPIRVLALEGGHNFREVGGYATASGARMRRGLVWRSAGLHRLTQADCAAIAGLGVRTIFDLRTARERSRYPTQETLARQVRTVVWEADPGAPRESNRPAWRNLDAAGVRAQIARLYASIADSHAAPFADIYRGLADGAAPALIHCAAGKDRTGLAIAILLELLGVTRAAVMWDYAQTNHHLDRSKLNLDAATGVGAAESWVAELSPEGLDLLMAADEAYLTSALEGMDARFGSVEGFARQRLGLSAATIAALRERLIAL